MSFVQDADAFQFKKAKKSLRAVDHKFRRKIMDFIKEKREVTVTEVYIHFRAEQSVVSNHLAILRGSDIVSTRREGKYIYYSIDADNYTRLLETSIAMCSRIAKK